MPITSDDTDLSHVLVVVGDRRVADRTDGYWLTSAAVISLYRRYAVGVVMFVDVN